jgi:hypothetical protein
VGSSRNVADTATSSICAHAGEAAAMRVRRRRRSCQVLFAKDSSFRNEFVVTRAPVSEPLARWKLFTPRIGRFVPQMIGAGDARGGRLRIARDAARLQRLEAMCSMTSLAPFCRMLTSFRLDRIGARKSLTLVNDADETR